MCRSYCHYKRDKKIQDIKKMAESINEIYRRRKRAQDERLKDSEHDLVEDV